MLCPFLKRAFDIVFSLSGLILLSPLLITAAVLIKREDGGPVFYRGVRAGKDLSEFRIYKFRSMVNDADRIGGPSTSGDDPRITKIGRKLRKTKLDELPQLINVLKGDMSIVGPRPEVLSEAQTYTGEERDVFSVKPGITDWASIEFHDEGALLEGSEDPHKAYREKIKPKKIELGLKYVREKGFITDMKIIFMTLGKVLGARQ
jgi:lipopolysaccharide/colanic/teichoic acid biosynthesis glycosyltransferase